MSAKLAQLQAMLEKQPLDTFLLYGLGMEYKNIGDAPRAIELFSKTIEVDPSYCYAYYQRGQTLESTGDETGARESYVQGIEAAKRANDLHAQSELQAALDMLE